MPMKNFGTVAADCRSIQAVTCCAVVYCRENLLYDVISIDTSSLHHRYIVGVEVPRLQLGGGSNNTQRA